MEGETEYLEQAWRHHEAGDSGRVVNFLKYNIALVTVLIVLILVYRITKLLWHHVVQLVGDIIGHIHHGHGVVPRVGLDGGH